MWTDDIVTVAGNRWMQVVGVHRGVPRERPLFDNEDDIHDKR